MTQHRILLAAVVALLTAAPALAQQADAVRLNEHVRVLASDEFEGRGVATPGEQLTVDYLVSQFRALGLEPGGPDGSWVQTAQLGRTRQDGPATITVSAGGANRALARGPDILVSSDRPVDRISVTDAEVVVAGYGVSAPERGWDDFKGMDLRGKILLVIVNDPDFGAPEGHPVAGRFDGNAMTFYGRWTYKFQEAARQGAAGVLVIHDTAGAGYGWSVLEGSSTAPKFDIVR
ncbi:MAG: peptidase M20, partial [bacterium]